jgi:transposase-like protein
MAKSVYIETTVASAYVSHRRDPASLYRRDVTQLWWEQQSTSYDLLTSEATLAELRAGAYPGQDEAIALVEDLPRLELTEEAVAVAELYIRHRVMPSPASGDALHLALASLNELDYLLTWNIRHLANPNKVEHITLINRRLGLVTPLVLSPETLWIEEAT